MSKKSIVVSERVDVAKASKIADAAKGFESNISLQKELMKANDAFKAEDLNLAQEMYANILGRDSSNLKANYN